MGWTLPFTIGNLHLLWYWALEYAPTGDLTKFAPEDLTYDLDLGTHTPEQFLQVLVEVGFLDRTEDKNEGAALLRLHDWPDYTNKCLRPKYRRYPERWHQVLRSYGIPVITRTSRRRYASVAAVPSSSETMVEYEPPGAARIDCGEGAARQGVASSDERNQHGPQGAVRVDCINDAARQGEGSGRDRSQLALRAVRRDSTSAIAEPEPQASTPTLEHPEFVSSDNAADRPELSSNSSTISTGVVAEANAPIPKSLSGRRNFTDWWRKLQELYQNKGCPLSAYEQSEILAMLARSPFTAVEKLQYSVVNFEKSYATLHKKQPANSS
jgi:hypothetical protein